MFVPHHAFAYLFDGTLHSKHDYYGSNSVVEYMKHYAWPDGLRAPTEKSEREADNEKYRE
jgi:hypothetical protein